MLARRLPAALPALPVALPAVGSRCACSRRLLPRRLPLGAGRLQSTNTQPRRRDQPEWAGQPAASAAAATPAEEPRDEGGGKPEGGEEPPKKGWRSIDRTIMKHVAILTGSQVMLNLGMGFMVPVMPLFAREMGGHLGATGVGLIIAAPSITRLLCNLPFGMLADKIGRKPLMWMGTAITSVSMIGHAAASSIGSLLSWRLLLGVGNSSSWSGSSAYMQDLSDKAPDHRGTILGFQQATIGSVWIVGPAIGGFCAEAWGLQNSFIIAGVGSALCSLGYRHLPETLKLGQKERDTAAEPDRAAEPDVRTQAYLPLRRRYSD